MVGEDVLCRGLRLERRDARQPLAVRVGGQRVLGEKALVGALFRRPRAAATALMQLRRPRHARFIGGDGLLHDRSSLSQRCPRHAAAARLPGWRAAGRPRGQRVTMGEPSPRFSEAPRGGTPLEVSAPMLILTLLAAAYWAFSLVNALRVVRAVPVLEDVDPPQPLRWPKLTLVIPARSEAAELEGALETRLREDYPDLQLVVVDDRSTDETGAILDRIAARDGRVVPVHVTELPRGWLGKLHAMHQGVQRASGEWILFTDADVHFQPGTLRRAVAY